MTASILDNRRSYSLTCVDNSFCVDNNNNNSDAIWQMKTSASPILNASVDALPLVSNVDDEPSCDRKCGEAEPEEDHNNYSLLCSSVHLAKVFPIVSTARFPVLDEDMRIEPTKPASHQHSTNASKDVLIMSSTQKSASLSRRITAVSECSWKSNINFSPIKTVKEAKMPKKNMFTKRKSSNNSIRTPDTLDLFRRRNSNVDSGSTLQPSTSSTFGPGYRVDPIRRCSGMSVMSYSTLMEQSIAGADTSETCGCTTLAWAQLRKSRLGDSICRRSQRRKNIRPIPPPYHLNTDDDSYKKSPRESPDILVAPSATPHKICTSTCGTTITSNADELNALLTPPNSTTEASSESTDSGLPSSLSSSSSSTSDCFAVASTSASTSKTPNSRLCPSDNRCRNLADSVHSACVCDTLPPYCTRPRMELQKRGTISLRLILHRVVRKFLDIRRKCSTNSVDPSIEAQNDNLELKRAISATTLFFLVRADFYF